MVTKTLQKPFKKPNKGPHKGLTNELLQIHIHYKKLILHH